MVLQPSSAAPLQKTPLKENARQIKRTVQEYAPDLSGILIVAERLRVGKEPRHTGCGYGYFGCPQIAKRRFRLTNVADSDKSFSIGADQVVPMMFVVYR